MSRNTVAGGMPDFDSVDLLSPLAAASDAALSLAAFSPSFFTSFAASGPVAAAGAGGGITDGDGAGDNTLVSGALAGSAFAGSAVFAGSVAAALVASGTGAGAGTTGAGAGTTALVGFAGSTAGALATVRSGGGVIARLIISATKRTATMTPRLMISLIIFFLSWTKAGTLSVTVEEPVLVEDCLRALGDVAVARSFMPSLAFCSAPSWCPTT